MRRKEIIPLSHIGRWGILNLNRISNDYGNNDEKQLSKPSKIMTGMEIGAIEDFKPKIEDSKYSVLNELCLQSAENLISKRKYSDNFFSEPLSKRLRSPKIVDNVESEDTENFKLNQCHSDPTETPVVIKEGGCKKSKVLTLENLSSSSAKNLDIETKQCIEIVDKKYSYQKMEVKLERSKTTTSR